MISTSRHRSSVGGHWPLVLLCVALPVAALTFSGWTDAYAEPIVVPAEQSTSQAGTAPKRLDARTHRVAKAVAHDIERVEPYLERYGYWAVFAAVGIEGVGIPAPGQTLLEAASLVAAVPRSKINIWLLLVVTILATSLGQGIGYLIGRSGGRAVLHRLPIPSDGLENIERSFNRYGGWLVIFGRFVDGPRQLIGLFSGVLAMHWARFMLLNVAGAILWASFWALGVYYLDLHFDSIVSALRQLNPWVAGASVLGVLALLLFVVIALFRRRAKNRPR